MNDISYFIKSKNLKEKSQISCDVLEPLLHFFLHENNDAQFLLSIENE